jgi:hypothetical protein
MQLVARQYGAIEWTNDAEAMEKKNRIYNPAAFQNMWVYYLRQLET